MVVLLLLLTCKGGFGPARQHRWLVRVSSGDSQTFWCSHKIQAEEWAFLEQAISVKWNCWCFRLSFHHLLWGELEAHVCGTAVGTSGRAREAGEECTRCQWHMVSSVMHPCLHLGMHPLLKTTIHSSVCLQHIYVWHAKFWTDFWRAQPLVAPFLPLHFWGSFHIIIIFSFLAAALLYSEDILLGNSICKIDIGLL